MYLMFVISLLCLLLAFCAKITKILLPFFCSDSSEVKEIKNKVSDLRADLAKISMRDEYIKYVKCERNIVALETALNEAKGRDNMKRVAYEYGLHYCGMAVLALIMMYISFSYRNTTIIVFGNNFNFEPFGGLISFPTQVPNSISVMSWIVVNNLVARTLAGYVK
ncbi:guided entry of tail-anchored proteins factor 1 [Anopheles nili]|uniref:guided entry of tail-anchored proteins factor 1 n=1 Tax=Anopheles nili TaxID=185578 RepID=UPI00237A76DB|nr:guided entry of tail-anchored proteins factor 1 [Anopheles nili]